MPCEPDLYFTVEDNRREVARMQKPNCGRSRRSGAIAPATRCSTRKTLPSSIERCSNCWRAETLSPSAHTSRGGSPSTCAAVAGNVAPQVPSEHLIASEEQGGHHFGSSPIERTKGPTGGGPPRGRRLRSPSPVADTALYQKRLARTAPDRKAQPTQKGRQPD